jgi:hypothetical protein
MWRVTHDAARLAGRSVRVRGRARAGCILRVVDVAAHGLFHPFGWEVDVGSDASGAAAAMASMHESMHDRLQQTTIWGCTMSLLFAVAESSRDDQARSTAMGMLAACRDTHEQFATWVAMVAARMRPEDLQPQYPRYFRYANRAERAVASVPGIYLRLHAAQAIARACMQPSAIVGLIGDGVGLLRLPQMDRSMRPDYRLAVLSRRLAELGWGELPANGRADMSLEEFAEGDDPDWLEVNQWFHRRAEYLLNGAGLPTLELDSHVPYVVAAQRRAVSDAGGPIGLRIADMSSSAGDGDVKDTVMFSFESEKLSIGPKLQTEILPPGTDPLAMLAGDSAHAHLFLVIRPAHRLALHYEPAPKLGLGQVALLRRIVGDGDERRVQLLDVSGHTAESLTALQAPLIASISMRSLADEPTAARWRPLLKPQTSTVLCDLRPSAHIISWLDKPNHLLKFSIIGKRTHVGLVRCLLFVMETHTGRSRLFLNVISRIFARGFDFWIAEHPRFDGRAIRDDALATGNDQLLDYTLAHLVTEERQFDFDAGDRPWVQASTSP